jgi:hypothetical protein
MRSKLLTWSLISVLGVALVAGVILYAPDTPERPRPTGDVITDADAFRVGLALQRFETVSDLLVDSYQDRDVSAADWVQSADDQIPIMVSAIRLVEARIAVTKGRERSDIKRYVRVSKDQLEAFSALRVALRELDTQGEIHAWNRLRHSSNRKSLLFQKGLERQHVNVDFFVSLPARVQPKSPTY